MFTIEYRYDDAKSFLSAIAASLQVQAEPTQVAFDTDLLTGYFRMFRIDDGLEAIIGEFTLHKTVQLKRNPSSLDIFSLRLEENDIQDEFVVKIGEEFLVEKPQKRAGISLINHLTEASFTGTHGMHSKGVYIVISRAWITRHLSLGIQDDYIVNYLKLQSSRYTIKPFDAEYRYLFEQCYLACEESDVLYESRIANRIRLILERYFVGIVEELNKQGGKNAVSVNEDELQRLMEIETFLVRDFSKPAPTISELSRRAAMSPTNLKKKFREVYNSSIYDYFQKNRMAKARALMLTGEYSIKEIGQMIGYQNLSNFTIAFKKEYNLLPSQIN